MSSRSHASPPVTSQHLTQMWSALNERYFGGLLPPIDLVWSRRLTSSVGLFVTRRGPRPQIDRDGLRPPTRREIRLSLPLLQQVVQQSEYGEQEIRSTLAHEMIQNVVLPLMNHFVRQRIHDLLLAVRAPLGGLLEQGKG